MSTNDGGPAFPFTEHSLRRQRLHGDGEPFYSLSATTYSGMSLRDYFAGQALVGYAANAQVMSKAIEESHTNGGPRPTCIAEWLAGLAYEVADAMLKARAT